MTKLLAIRALRNLVIVPPSGILSVSTISFLVYPVFLPDISETIDFTLSGSSKTEEKSLSYSSFEFCVPPEEDVVYILGKAFFSVHISHVVRDSSEDHVALHYVIRGESHIVLPVELFTFTAQSLYELYAN